MGIIVSLENSSKQERADLSDRLLGVKTAARQEIGNRLGPDAARDFDHALRLSLVNERLTESWICEEARAAYDVIFDTALAGEYANELRAHHVVERIDEQ